jgi:hypothetical protein
MRRGYVRTSSRQVYSRGHYVALHGRAIPPCGHRSHLQIWRTRGSVLLARQVLDLLGTPAAGVLPAAYGVRAFILLRPGSGVTSIRGN